MGAYRIFFWGSGSIPSLKCLVRSTRAGEKPKLAQPSALPMFFSYESSEGDIGILIHKVAFIDLELELRKGLY